MAVNKEERDVNMQSQLNQLTPEVAKATKPF